MKQPLGLNGCKKIPRNLGLPVLLAALTTGSYAAEPTSALPANIDREFLEKLVNRVNQSESELKDLKAQVAIKNGETASAMPAAPQFPNLQFHGFADISYHWSSREGINNASGVPYNPPGTHSGNSFYTGEFDLFLQSQLAEDLSMLAETVVASSTANEWGLDVERLMLSWTPSEYFNVDFGRFHTAMGYYNTAYHHGTWFQNAVGRPNFLEYEDAGGLLPVHSVGLSIHGALPSGGLNLAYIFEVANGRNYTTTGGQVQNVADGNSGKALNLELIAKPDWLPGSQFGAGVYHDFLSPENLPNADEWIFSAHAVYHRALWEFMAEGFLIRHRMSGDRAHYTPMFYAQAARKFGQFTPYARFTYSHASANDQIYTTILNQAGVHYGPSAGVRYDFSTFAALKLQYDYAFDTGYNRGSEVTVQAAFTF